MTHTLKTWPIFFKAIKEGRKNFELRKHDRLFATGDTLVLQEYKDDDESPGYTGAEMTFEIGYILTAVQFPNGLKKDYCILGLREKPDYS